MTDRLALLIGPDSALGVAIAEALSRDGLRVMGFPATSSAQDTDGQAMRGSDAREWVAHMERQNGRIEAAISVCDYADAANLEDVTSGVWYALLRHQLCASFTLAAAVAPTMRARGYGSIVNVISSVAQSGRESFTHLASTHAAVIGLSRALAHELGPSGIRVNVVAYGPIDVPSLPAALREPGVYDSMPLRRLGRAEEVAEVVRRCLAFSFLTGQVISVNGGEVIQ
jgi:NAD(P)-dependent dehydrogenase (short-subunit alcohol dehydrogenase family)